MRRRRAARVVLLDRDDRILLFTWRSSPVTGGRDVWITPGGGVKVGESFERAARRELAEEVGLHVDAFSPCVWRREHRLEHLDVTLVERYFVARAASQDVDRSGHDDTERVNMGEHRWWSVAEIARSDDLFAPRHLAAHLAALLRDGPPPQPVDVGV